MRGKRFAEKAGMGAHPYWGPWLCSAGMPFPEKHRWSLLGVNQDSACGAGWARENRYDRGARQKRSPKTADCYLRAQWDVVGAALAALSRIVTEINGIAPAHSRTYRNILSAVGVLCADRMPLFIKNFSSDACFQQGPRRRSGESLQDRHIRTCLQDRHNRRSCHRGSTRAANRVVRKDRWTMGRVPAIRSAVYEYRNRRPVESFSPPGNTIRRSAGRS